MKVTIHIISYHYLLSPYYYGEDYELVIFQVLLSNRVYSA